MISVMLETVLNIYLIIQNNSVVSFKAKSYQKDGTDEDKINFLKERSLQDYEEAEVFSAPQNKSRKFMPYKKFSKLESQGMQFQLFEEIFQHYNVPQNPLICVTPVVDGKILI